PGTNRWRQATAYQERSGRDCDDAAKKTENNPHRQELDQALSLGFSAPLKGSTEQKSQNRQEDKEVVPKSSTLNYSSQKAIDLNKLRSRKANYQSDAHRERSEEHTSELQSRGHLVCRLLLEKK